MFYIKHNTDNFSIIDCYLSADNQEDIVEEIKAEKKGKTITRFISTHPDKDHLLGLDYLDDQIDILNFYCVENNAIKNEITPDFEPSFARYCELRDSDKAFYLKRGCSRKWITESGKNDDGNDYGWSGISILWPVLTNRYYLEELENANKGESFNNISVILKYDLKDGVSVLWMGDLETDFMEKVVDDIVLPKIDILFAPHHGRDTGKVPEKWLSQMNPKIVIIGEAPAEDLNYYQDYNIITQNSAQDITLECITGKVHIYASNEKYSVDFLDNEYANSFPNHIGTLNL